MDIGKLPNHVNIVLCVWLFFFDVCFLYFFFFSFLTGWEFRINYLQHLSSFGIELQWQRQQIFSKIKLRQQIFSKVKLRVRLDTVYFTENWKHGNKIIFKCVNSVWGPFLMKVLLKKRFVLESTETRFSMKKKRETQTHCICSQDLMESTATRFSMKRKAWNANALRFNWTQTSTKYNKTFKHRYIF